MGLLRWLGSSSAGLNAGTGVQRRDDGQGSPLFGRAFISLHKPRLPAWGASFCCVRLVWEVARCPKLRRTRRRGNASPARVVLVVFLYKKKEAPALCLLCSPFAARTIFFSYLMHVQSLYPWPVFTAKPIV
jgi:hypothetical protein